MRTRYSLDAGVQLRCSGRVRSFFFTSLMCWLMLIVKHKPNNIKTWERRDGVFVTIWFWTVFYIDFVFPLSPKNFLPDLITSNSSAVYIGNRNCIPFASTWVHLCCFYFLVGSVLLLFFEFCVVILCTPRSNSELKDYINKHRKVGWYTEIYYSASGIKKNTILSESKEIIFG